MSAPLDGVCSMRHLADPPPAVERSANVTPDAGARFSSSLVFTLRYGAARRQEPAGELILGRMLEILQYACAMVLGYISSPSCFFMSILPGPA